ncbi:uncharacterized protein LOC106097691 isoform X2 [Oreochromis niloticus]|uniref:uncharacterized protein LOC106097691 isoform X2 n=1 Tax=Oreochromis niloticus TaxID=8128 RepID=UPI000DF1C1DC|nr:uncharacterized protein LOC106097691 isoform X2 [Oreochromis niloticus]
MIDRVYQSDVWTVVVFSFIMSGLLLLVIFVIFSPELQGQGQKPQMSVHHFDGEYVLILCSLPGSVKDDTRCNLYFGEASRAVLNQTVKKERNKKDQRFCQFYVSVADFLRHLLLVQQKDASCDYSLENEPNSLSPRSERMNMKNILEKESPTTKVNSPCTMTTEFPKLQNPTSQKKKKTSESRATTTKSTSTTATAKPQQNTSPSTTVNSPSKSESSLTTPRASISNSTVDSPSEEVSRKTNTKSSFTLTTDSNKTDTTVKVEESLWNLAAAVTRYGIVVGFILLVLGLHIFKRRTGDFVRMRTINHGGSLPAGNDGGSSVILSVPGDNCLTIEENINLQQMKNEDSDIYHVYGTISEETDAPDSQDTI